MQKRMLQKQNRRILGAVPGGDPRHVDGFVDGLAGPDRNARMLPSDFHSARDMPGTGTVAWKYRHADISLWLVQRSVAVALSAVCPA